MKKPLCTVFFFNSCKVFHFESWAFSAATSHGCDLWWLRSGSSKQSCFGVPGVAVPSQVAGLAAGTVWNQTGNGFFCVLLCFLHNIPPFVNAWVPYLGRKTRISLSSFIPPITLHIFRSFINFLLKTNSPTPFRFVCNIKAFQWIFHSIYMPALWWWSQTCCGSPAGSKDAQLLYHCWSSPCCKHRLTRNSPSNSKKPSCDNPAALKRAMGPAHFILKGKKTAVVCVLKGTEIYF